MSPVITVQRLIACGVSPTQAKLFAEPLSAVLNLYAINTRVRVAAFLAQAMHETKNFTALEENLYYSSPERVQTIFRSRVTSLAEAQKLVKNPKALANRVYSNRFGNGDEASGDGWRYRGRGLFHLTFKDNYEAMERKIGNPYVKQPDLVSQPVDACLTGAEFWMMKNCMVMADASNIDAVSKAVNPGGAGLGERRQNFDTALAVFA